MNSKFKKICVAITTLILSLSMSLESFADTHYNGDQGGGGSNHSKYENYASSRPSIWLDYPNQGLQIVVQKFWISYTIQAFQSRIRDIYGL